MIHAKRSEGIQTGKLVLRRAGPLRTHLETVELDEGMFAREVDRAERQVTL
jgi:hypothetical protein